MAIALAAGMFRGRGGCVVGIKLPEVHRDIKKNPVNIGLQGYYSFLGRRVLL